MIVVALVATLALAFLLAGGAALLVRHARRGGPSWAVRLAWVLVVELGLVGVGLVAAAVLALLVR